MNGGLIGMIAIYAVIIGLVYLFLLRPNSKKKKEEAAMRNNLEIGDEITTIGGIVRDGEGLLVSGGTQIEAGDSVVVFCHEVDMSRLEKFFR